MISLLKPTLPQISVLDFMEKYRNEKGKVPTPGNIKPKMEIRHEKLIISQIYEVIHAKREDRQIHWEYGYTSESLGNFK